MVSIGNCLGTQYNAVSTLAWYMMINYVNSVYSVCSAATKIMKKRTFVKKCVFVSYSIANKLKQHVPFTFSVVRQATGSLRLMTQVKGAELNL